MISDILFVISFVFMVYFIVWAMGAIVGHTIRVPVPFFHFMNWTGANAYISFFGIGYQVWFWSNYLGVL